MIGFRVEGTPPSKLSQNSRMDWRPRQAIKHDWQLAATVGARDATERAGPSFRLDPTKRYWMHYEVYWEKGHRIVDDDNLVASCKPARDAIAQVFGIDDKQFRTGEVTQYRDPTGIGYTRVWIEERNGPWTYAAPVPAPNKRRRT